jgi:cytoskeletal protein CcmA (bactofilin family)
MNSHPSSVDASIEIIRVNGASALQNRVVTRLHANPLPNRQLADSRRAAVARQRRFSAETDANIGRNPTAARKTLFAPTLKPFLACVLLACVADAGRPARPFVGGAMFNREQLFKKDELLHKDAKPVAALAGNNPAAAVRTPQAEPSRPEAPAKPAPARESEAKGSRLIVGPDIKLKGAEITDCDTLVVEGRVEAAMDSRVIQIAEQGVFSGTVGIDIAEIHGRFEGDLTARKTLVIHATGRVTGKIRYGKLSIEEGGELSGDIGALNAPETLRRAVAKPATGMA